MRFHRLLMAVSVFLLGAGCVVANLCRGRIGNL